MIHLLKTYLKRLSDLSGNNRSLMLGRLSTAQDVDIHLFNFLHGEDSFFILRQLISGKKKIRICAVQDSRDHHVNELSLQLKKVNKRAKLIQEEKGTHDLYLGWPFVEGKFSDATPVRCPLLFFPVELREEQQHWNLVLRDNEPVQLNKSFLLAYGYFNQCSIAEEWFETDWSDSFGEARVFLTALYDKLKDSPLEINFNRELFEEKINPFRNYKKEDFQQQHNAGELKLQSEAVVGIFPQAGSYLVPDYEWLIAQESSESMQHFFNEHFFAGNNAPALYKEEQSYHCFRIDASQEMALRMVRQGNSLVVQGPPGSGKSELICNLISDYIGRGKKVLLVCQKKAALDVVQGRMSSAGFGDFLALVHDHRYDRKKLYEKISDQIEKIDEYKKTNSSLDSIRMERTFVSESRNIDQYCEEIDRFKEALYSEKEFGISAKELYLTSSPEEEYFEVGIDLMPDHISRWGNTRKQLQRYLPYGIKIEQENYPWKNRKDFSVFVIADQNKIQKTIRQAKERLMQSQQFLSEKISGTISFEQIISMTSEHDCFSDTISIISSEEELNCLREIMLQKNFPVTIAWRDKINSIFQRGTSAKVSKPENYEVYLQRLNALQKGSGWTFFWWKLFGRDREIVKELFNENKYSFHYATITPLLQKLEVWKSIQEYKDKWQKNKWLPSLSSKEFDLKSVLQKLDLVDRWSTQVEKIKKHKNCFGIISNSKIEFETFKQIADEIKTLRALINGWEAYLIPMQLYRLENTEFYQQLLTTLERDFDHLCEADRITSTFTNAEKKLVSHLCSEYTRESPEELLHLVDNSVRLTWLGILEKKYPALRIVSTHRMHQLEELLSASVELKEASGREILLMRLRDRTYTGLEYNRLQNRITYRDLHHQVTKKKMIWPVRKIFQEFSEEIFNLIPCWLASPETVSAVFPMKEMFDLVIFDESSQCFSEKALPASCRGKQIVIAGDDQQLRPNDLYSVRWQDDEEDQEPDLEVESWLDLCKRYLPQIMLEGHYRSRHAELIGFSNQHFYKGKLRFIPDRNLLQTSAPVIEYKQVAGVWEQGINREEAQHVATLISELIRNENKKSIGVITFNFKQAELIGDYLEALSLEQNILIPESVFIKNIENVQGDERDIIIFSVGYAPDKNGRMLMQFGSLNLEGGENRLNVAVTRAREKIYLVSSILPQQLKVENVAHKGPVLLKDYLEYAWRISSGKAVETTPVPLPEHRAHWYLKSKLTNEVAGFSVSSIIPGADLLMNKQNIPTGVLLTDDELYNHSALTKDAHVYFPTLLKEKGWSVQRVYSRQFWKDKTMFIDELKQWKEKIC